VERLPVAWKTVYQMVKRVPKGRVITYGRLARAVKLRGGARAAGYAMAACPTGRAIPWHRVVGAGGRILLREPRAALQRRLLESEGIEFHSARLDIEEREWVPPAPRKRSGRTIRRAVG
jgi:methylated-DNA-protein-cysteine methyltransferase related protein